MYLNIFVAHEKYLSKTQFKCPVSVDGLEQMYSYDHSHLSIKINMGEFSELIKSISGEIGWVLE